MPSDLQINISPKLICIMLFICSHSKELKSIKQMQGERERNTRVCCVTIHNKMHNTHNTQQTTQQEHAKHLV